MFIVSTKQEALKAAYLPVLDDDRTSEYGRKLSALPKHSGGKAGEVLLFVFMEPRSVLVIDYVPNVFHSSNYHGTMYVLVGRFCQTASPPYRSLMPHHLSEDRMGPRLCPCCPLFVSSIGKKQKHIQKFLFCNPAYNCSFFTRLMVSP